MAAVSAGKKCPRPTEFCVFRSSRDPNLCELGTSFACPREVNPKNPLQDAFRRR